MCWKNMGVVPRIVKVAPSKHPITPTLAVPELEAVIHSRHHPIYSLGKGRKNYGLAEATSIY